MTLSLDSSSVIQAHNLTKRFGDFAAVERLNAYSCQLISPLGFSIPRTMSNQPRTLCPEGQELTYAKNGCKVCAKKKLEKIEKDKCGKKMKPAKKQSGGILEMIKKYRESKK